MFNLRYNIITNFRIRKNMIIQIYTLLLSVSLNLESYFDYDIIVHASLLRNNVLIFIC